MQGGKTKKEVFGCQATAKGPPGLLTDLYEMKKKRKETTMIVGFLQQRWVIRGTQEKTQAVINIHLYRVLRRTFSDTHTHKQARTEKVRPSGTQVITINITAQ